MSPVRVALPVVLGVLTFGCSAPPGSGTDAGGTAGGATGDPTVCGAPLGAACDSAKPCDLGLACQAGTCACVAPPCAVACWPDRVVSHLEPSGDTLFVSHEGTTPSWAITRIDPAGDGPHEVARGDGGVQLSATSDTLWIAWGPQPGSSTVERMRFDGSERKVVIASTMWVRWLLVTATDLFTAHGRVIRRWDLQGTVPTQLVNDAAQNVPRWLAVDGATLYWVNDNVDVGSDSLYQLTLPSGPPTLVTNAGTSVMVMRACADGLVWATDSSVQRLARGAQEPSWLATAKAGVACQGQSVYLSGFGAATAEGQEPQAIRALAADGTVKVLYQPNGPSTAAGQSTLELVASPSYLFWVQTLGGVQRIMRLARP